MEAAAQKYRNVAQRHQRDQLILHHLEYVRHIIGKIVSQLPAGIDAENLESAGVLGLVEAAKNFDVDHGTSFKTFAYPRIRGAILDELRRNSPLPQNILQQIGKVHRACETLSPPVTIEVVSKETGLTTEEVENCLEAIRLTRPTTWNDSISQSHSHRQQRLDQPGTVLEAAETKQVLADCIELLPEKERLVITLYYLEDLRLKEIGRVLKLSESRVSRILAKAEFRLKEYVRTRGG